MKKIFFAIAILPLIAAGCASSGTVSTGTPTPSNTAPAAAASGNDQAAVQANVNVNGPDDATNILIKDASDEQVQTSSNDDSDLTNSDSAEMDGFTNVSSGY